MSRLSRAFRPGTLVCYLTAGYPSYEKSIDYVMACVEGGADVIELGVPFTDPVADGKVIQMASQVALEQGMTPSRVLRFASEIRSRTEVPLVLMGYYNPIFVVGEAEFAERAAEAGVDGLIVPDLPVEECSSLRQQCQRRSMDLVQLVAPTTPEERMAKIARRSSGFLYVVSSMGTTGERVDLDDRVGALVARAKQAAGPLPVGVGFGVSTPQQVRSLRDHDADGVIVGSALLRKVASGESPRGLESYVRSLKG